MIAPTFVEKAAAGVHVTVGEYKGDSLANSNKGDRTSKHNGVLRPPRMPSGRARLAASSSGIKIRYSYLFAPLRDWSVETEPTRTQERWDCVPPPLAH